MPDEPITPAPLQDAPPEAVASDVDRRLGGDPAPEASVQPVLPRLLEDYVIDTSALATPPEEQTLSPEQIELLREQAAEPEPEPLSQPLLPLDDLDAQMADNFRAQFNPRP